MKLYATRIGADGGTELVNHEEMALRLRWALWDQGFEFAPWRS